MKTCSTCAGERDRKNFCPPTAQWTRSTSCSSNRERRLSGSGLVKSRHAICSRPVGGRDGRAFGTERSSCLLGCIGGFGASCNRRQLEARLSVLSRQTSRDI